MSDNPGTPPRSEHLSRPGGDLHGLRWLASRPGAPRLVFCHATGLSAAPYARLLAPLAEHFEVWALDARGHGRSRAPAQPEALTSWTPYIEDLQAWLAHIGGPVHLAGHSMGSLVSLDTAHRLP